MDLVENKQPEEETAHASEPEPEHEAAPARHPRLENREHLGDREEGERADRREPESSRAGVRLPADRPADAGQATLSVAVQTELRESSACLLDTLDSFNIEAQIIGIVRGPSVTRFELTIPRGIKISRITALADDIADCRPAWQTCVSRRPGWSGSRSASVPNKTVNTVFIREYRFLRRLPTRKPSVLPSAGHHRQAGHR